MNRIKLNISELTKAAFAGSVPYSLCLILYNVIMYIRSTGTILAFDALGMLGIFVIAYLFSLYAVSLPLARASYLYFFKRESLSRCDVLIFVFLVFQLALPWIAFSLDP